MKQDSVNKDSLIFPSVPSPAESLDGIASYKYRIEPEVVAVKQPYIGKPIHATTKIPLTSAKVKN